MMDAEGYCGSLSRVAKNGRRQWRIQSLLQLLVLGCILPSLAMAVFFITQFYQHQRADLEQSTIATARALMQAVDRELTSAQLALSILATSGSLQVGDLAAFHARALAVLPTQLFGNVTLVDASGQQFVNTLLPFGRTLPRASNPELMERVIETGRPAVSDLHIGGVLHQPLITVVVPGPLPGQGDLCADGRPVSGQPGRGAKARVAATWMDYGDLGQHRYNHRSVE